MAEEMTEKYKDVNDKDFNNSDKIEETVHSKEKDQQQDLNIETESEEQKVAQKEETQNEAEKYLSQLRRVQAEFLNYKRRTEQRMRDYEDTVTSNVLSRLLPVIDDFDIYFQHHKDEYTEDARSDGIQLIYNKLLVVLKEMGLEPIEAEGHPFEPELHEAVLTEETEEVDEGTVLKVWQKGFLFKGRLLRPAKVVTAKAPEENNAR